MNKVAIYTRKSKETDTGESIKTQIQICKDYFLNKNDNYVFEIFQDEGFSGSNVNRPEFQRMMLLAKTGEFDIIACYKVDRIGRNIIDFMNTFDELEKNNITLVSVTEGFDPSTPAGRMMMTMIAGFAEMERMNIAQRVKDNMSALAKMGRWSGGTPPTGYKSVRLPNGNKTAMYLELIPEWRGKLQNIFEMASSNNTICQISKLLNMSPKTINNILANPVYCQSDLISKKYLESLGYTVFGELNKCGYLAYNRRPRSKNSKKMFNASDMFVAVSKHEAPISSTLWISANESIKQRGYESKPRISQFTFLAHKVKCFCGHTMQVNVGHKRKDGTKTYYFRCSSQHSSNPTNTKICKAKWINVRYLEEDILEMLKNIYYDQSILEEYINKNSPKNINLEIKNLKNQITKNNKKLDALADKLVLLDKSAAVKVADKMNALSKENDNLNNKLLNLEQESVLNDIGTINVDTLQNNIKTLLLYWDKLPMEERQVEIGNIIYEIRSKGDGDFDVVFNI